MLLKKKNLVSTNSLPDISNFINLEKPVEHPPPTVVYISSSQNSNSETIAFESDNSDTIPFGSDSSETFDAQTPPTLVRFRVGCKRQLHQTTNHRPEKAPRQSSQPVTGPVLTNTIDGQLIDATNEANIDSDADSDTDSESVTKYVFMQGKLWAKADAKLMTSNAIWHKCPLCKTRYLASCLPINSDYESSSD